jgi:hypothetical protein
MMHRRLLLICAFLCSLATPVGASLTIPADLNTLAAEAYAIAHGVVVDVRARQTTDAVRVETLVTIQVSAYWKGDLGEEVTFAVAGGRLGRYRSLVVGAPQFAAGEEVVLFLGARPPSFPYVLRLSQGAFHVKQDERTGERTVTRLPLSSDSGAPPIVRGAAGNRPLSLESFSALVRAAVEKSR